MTADFVWRMEPSLDLSAEPYDPERPLICFAEMPYPRLAEAHAPWPVQPGKPRREDYAYVRQGTCNVLLAFAPRTGWRHLVVSQTRKHPGFARCMQTLATTYAPTAKDMRVVLDTLSTHTPVAFYEPFEPEVARTLTRQRSFHYPPKHGSWLNMAAGECSVLARQGWKQRIAPQDHLQTIAQHWAAQRTGKRRTVNWQFPTEKAREKFKRFYPH